MAPDYHHYPIVVATYRHHSTDMVALASTLPPTRRPTTADFVDWRHEWRASVKRHLLAARHPERHLLSLSFADRFLLTYPVIVKSSSLRSLNNNNGGGGGGANIAPVDRLSQLPVELLAHIFNHLPPADIRHCRLINTYLSAVSTAVWMANDPALFTRFTNKARLKRWVMFHQQLSSGRYWPDRLDLSVLKVHGAVPDTRMLLTAILSDVEFASRVRQLDLSNLDGQVPAALLTEFLAQAERLDVLRLNQCPTVVTDSLFHQARLPCLRHLEIHGCKQLTNGGLVVLANAMASSEGGRGLEHFEVSSAPRVTGAGLTRLFAATRSQPRILTIMHCGKILDGDLGALSQCSSRLVAGKLIANAGRVSPPAVEFFLDHCPELRHFQIVLPLVFDNTLNGWVRNLLWSDADMMRLRYKYAHLEVLEQELECPQPTKHVFL